MMKVAYTGWTWINSRDPMMAKRQLESSFRECKFLGYDYVENFAFIRDFFAENPQELVDMTRACGVNLVNLYGHFNFDIEASLETAKAQVKFLADVGGKWYNCQNGGFGDNGPSERPTNPEMIDKMCEITNRLGEYAKDLGVTVCFHPHYGTCVLPFAVSPLPDGVKAYSAKGLDDTGQLVVLSEVTQLAAYTPYILYSASGYSGSLLGTVDANKYGVVVSDGLLRGAIAPQKCTDGYVLQDLGEGAKFYAMDGVEFLIPEGKCWLEMPAAQASAPQYGIQIGTTTAITAPTTSASAHGKIYTLDGKQVKTMLPGGIYVVNGKKVLKIK